ncbi:MAG: D-2-hydroxyacid dehydrogenase [Bacteroidales bacterium]|nr:D-2-hydroxyacid dehydrogenase [Bacteroidales bacterium]
MKITILDGATIGSDINLDELKKFGEVEFYETTFPTETKNRISDSEIIITNKVVINEPEFEVAKKLQLVCVAATGYNNINIDAAKKHNVVVANVKGYSTESVAQHVFANILAFSNSVIDFNNQIKHNFWQQSPIFTSLSFPVAELSGKNLGIIGYGSIGKRVAEIAKVFGMNILISARKNSTKIDLERLDFEEVVKKSDFLTIHCPLTKETENLIAEKEFNMMKKSAIIVNTARGGIVNEKDLFYALKNKQIRGAVVDVISKEPPSDGNILFNAPNILITPHIAWTSFEARKKLVAGIISNIEDFLAGNIDKIKIG